MANRSIQQKIGAQGHKWLVAEIENHPHWVSRDLGEDFGVDIEAELTEFGVRGEILKIQIKTSNSIERTENAIKVSIERRYIENSETCRYPLILIFVDLKTKQAWYLWMQQWWLQKSATADDDVLAQGSWTEVIPDYANLSKGLEGPLKSIAQWKGETQFVLSLRDALRSAAAMMDLQSIRSIAAIIEKHAPTFATSSLDTLISQAIALGDRMWGTEEGNEVSILLYEMVRRGGGKVLKTTVERLVLRGDNCSRVGLNALGFLYDDFFDHIKSLKLADFFLKKNPQVAYYCAYRDKFPEAKSFCFGKYADGFSFAGLRYIPDGDEANRFANRGESALTDRLFLIDEIE